MGLSPVRPTVKSEDFDVGSEPWWKLSMTIAWIVWRSMPGAHSDHAGWLAQLENAFGTRGTDFALAQLNRLIAHCRDTDSEIDNVRPRWR